ncbi:MAG: hypothetical protein L3J47_08220 [Sulfurovum sp.]|nr:hypothetical protein [Sulfurovum sp.]
MNARRSCANIPLSKESVIDIYLLLFLIIVLVGSVTVTIYYLKEKNEELNAIKRGFCPRCRKDTIELVDQRSGGCSGPKILTYECSECGYHNSFSVEEQGGCGSGRCG